MIDPVSDAVAQVFPVVMMLYPNGEPIVVVGVPDIVKVVPTTAALTPVGKPVTVAPVAPPPNVYVIGTIALLTQTDCVSVEASELKEMV